jgi:CheY-like chemotaxis protein
MKPTSVKMLIVDDDVFISIMLRDFFKGTGYEILTAADGEEALKVCMEKKPDFIITDIMLPQMSGIELIKKLRSTDEFAVTPIIAFTAGSITMREDAKKAGAHLVLEKPIRRIDLLQKVDELLEATPFIPR